MFPVSLIFTSGIVSGVNCYAAVLVLGLAGRFGHIAAIPHVLEQPGVLAAAAILYLGQFVAGKIPAVDVAWDVVHTALRPVVAAAIGVVVARHTDPGTAATVASAALGGASALSSHIVKTGVRIVLSASPEPVSTIVASVLEDAVVVGLTFAATRHPLATSIVAAVFLAAGIALLVFLAARIRRAWRHRREARQNRRSRGTSVTAA